MDSLVIWFATILLIHFLLLIGSNFIQKSLSTFWDDENANRADFHLLKVFVISLRNYCLDYRNALNHNLEKFSQKKISYRSAFVGLILSQENLVLFLFALLLIGKVNFYWIIVGGGALWSLSAVLKFLRTPGVLLSGLGAFLFLANELFAKVTVLRTFMGGEYLGLVLLDKSMENLIIFVILGVALGALIGALELMVAIMILVMAGLVHLYVAFYFASALLIGHRLSALWTIRKKAKVLKLDLIWKSEMSFLIIDSVMVLALAPMALAYLTVFGGAYEPFLRADQWVGIMIAFQVLSLGIRSTWAHFYYQKNAKKLEALV